MNIGTYNYARYKVAINLAKSRPNDVHRQKMYEFGWLNKIEDDSRTTTCQKMTEQVSKYVMHGNENLISRIFDLKTCIDGTLKSTGDRLTGKVTA